MEDSSDICYPISDINSVLQWRCDKNCWIDKHSVSVLSDKTEYLNVGHLLDVRDKNTVFSEYKLPQSSVPRTVFCHDFKGGYLEDRFCNGSPNTDTYRFWNWSVIDIFIYFSHKLVTIPPHGWIDAGHKHGVPVLGTLITEWDEGETIWNAVLSDVDKTNLFSQKLAEICAHFKFDGYLLNVENKISKDYIPCLINFVALLKLHLNLYCKKKTWLLWYDSVTVEGTLDWQNKLCPLNKPFFDQCDGIFLNYVWTPCGLIDSLKEAGDRKLDVYVGVDVWGRNCYYDGGFNLDKAMGVLRSLNMSVAIFAPGWTFEAAPQEQFTQREQVFWEKISRYLYVHGPVNLPFQTNFCQGILQYNDRVLFNLSAQQYQPTRQPCSSLGSCVSLCLSDGNSQKQTCLEVKALCEEHSKQFHRVFVCDFSGNGKNLEIGLVLRNSPIEPARKFQIFFIVEDKLSFEGKQAINMSSTPRGNIAKTKADNVNVVASVMDFTKENQSDEAKIEIKPLDTLLVDTNDPWHKVLERDPRDSEKDLPISVMKPGSLVGSRILVAGPASSVPKDEDCDCRISPLGRSGGSNVCDVTKGILKKLFTDALGSQFSWYGVKGKKALASSPVADVLLAAVRANKATRETTDAEIIYVTKYWLRHAP